MRFKKPFVIILSLIYLSISGCASLNEQQVFELKLGSTMEEVKNSVGNPLTQNSAHSHKDGRKSQLNINVWEYRNLFGQKTTLLYFCENKLMQIEKMQGRTYEWPPIKFECE